MVEDWIINACNFLTNIWTQSSKWPLHSCFLLILCNTHLHATPQNYYILRQSHFPGAGLVLLGSIYVQPSRDNHPHCWKDPKSLAKISSKALEITRCHPGMSSYEACIPVNLYEQDLGLCDWAVGMVWFVVRWPRAWVIRVSISFKQIILNTLWESMCSE